LIDLSAKKTEVETDQIKDLCMVGFTYIYYQFKPNVGKYSIHGAFGMRMKLMETDDDGKHKCI